jgi:hypothetical protein
MRSESVSVKKISRNKPKLKAKSLLLQPNLTLRKEQRLRKKRKKLLFQYQKRRLLLFYQNLLSM